MAKLYTKIDRIRGTALFYGPGTFDAKDAIKSLGRARWLGDRKMWEVSGFTLSTGDLLQQFTECVIEEEIFSGESEDAQVGVLNAVPLDSGARATNGQVSRHESSVPAQAESTLEVATGASITSLVSGASFSVSEFAQATRNALRGFFPATFCVYGVISSVKTHPNGRTYLDLADPQNRGDVVNCVAWEKPERVFRPLLDAGFAVEPDLEVMFKVAVDLNRRRMSVSLRVVGVVAEYTKAKLAAMREVTNQRLQAEGIFALNKQRSLPFLPVKLGVLTSAGGTVIHDFRAALDTAAFGFELYWINIRVQGADSKHQVLEALRRLEQRQLDAILIFRGGGSAADLAVFNEYELAKAVCLCPVPVVSAIGHQADQSSVQDVSFAGLGVPKDVGRFFADIIEERRRGLAETARSIRQDTRARMLESSTKLELEVERIQRASLHRVEVCSQSLTDAMRRIPVYAAQFRLSAEERYIRTALPIRSLVHQATAIAAQRLEQSVATLRHGARSTQQTQRTRLQSGLERLSHSLSAHWLRWSLQVAAQGEIVRRAIAVVERAELQLVAREETLQVASPDSQLRRGFSLVRNRATGGYVTSAASLSTADEIELEFHDAIRIAVVKE